jgi:hypothetical protein
MSGERGTDCTTIRASGFNKVNSGVWKVFASLVYSTYSLRTPNGSRPGLLGPFSQRRSSLASGVTLGRDCPWPSPLFRSPTARPHLQLIASHLGLLARRRLALASRQATPRPPTTCSPPFICSARLPPSPLGTV